MAPTSFRAKWSPLNGCVRQAPISFARSAESFSADSADAAESGAQADHVAPFVADDANRHISLFAADPLDAQTGVFALILRAAQSEVAPVAWFMPFPLACYIPPNAYAPASHGVTVTMLTKTTHREG
jgi:hypothetical protein